MYRQADRIVVVAHLGYLAGGYLDLLKPWVKGLKHNALGSENLKDFVIEPH